MANFSLVELKTYGTSTSTTTGRVGARNSNHYWASLRVKIVPAENLKSISFTLKVTSFYTVSANRFTYGLTTNETTTAPSIASFEKTYVPSIPANTSGGSRNVSVTFEGDFQAGVPYFIWLRSNSEAAYAALFHSFAYVIDGESKGAVSYIFTTVDEEAQTHESSANFSAQQRYTSTNGANSGWAPANWVMPENTNNICGGGLNNTANGCLIPIPAADFAASSLTWRAKIYKSPSGVDVFRWAVTAASQEACAAYVNGKNVSEVTAAQDPLQLASGIFSPEWGAAQTGIFEMSIDFPAPVSAFTALNLVLWGTSQSYGNIHIQSAVKTFLRSVALSGMGWVPYNPYLEEGGLWQPFGPRIHDASDWGV